MKFMKKVVLGFAVLALAVSPALTSNRFHLGTAEARTSGSFAFSADLSLSAREKAAEAVLAAQREIFLEYYRADLEVPFTGQFREWRSHLEASQIYQSLRRMPKGGLLHIHDGAVGDTEWIVDRALSEPDCFIYWGPASDVYFHGQLAFFPGRRVPPGWVRVRKLARMRPHIRKELLKLYTLGPEDDACADIWEEFEAIFQRVDKFICYRPVFLDYYRHALLSMARDGIQFVELRTAVDPILAEDGESIADESVLDLYRLALADVHDRYPEFNLRIIVCTWRGATLAEAAEQMARARAFTEAFPELVNGFDVIGEEDAGNSNAFYAPVLTSEPRVPLFLHGGESLSLADTNVGEALDLGARRISHGINLGLFPGLEEKLRRANVTMEVCPISNQTLRYISDLRDHPAKGWLQRGLQAVLGSDDPAIFGSTSLSDDVALAYLAWGLDLRSLKKLALNSITASSLPAQRKRRQLQLFSARWQQWIEDVLARQDAWDAVGFDDAALRWLFSNGDSIISLSPFYRLRAFH